MDSISSIDEIIATIDSIDVEEDETEFIPSIRDGTAVRGLLCSVIQQAYTDIMCFHGRGRRLNAREVSEADYKSAVFFIRDESFISICKFLNLNGHVLRKEILKYAR